MSGDPSNAGVWANGDVYIGALGATTPGMDASSPKPDGSDFSSDWDLVGLLDGGDGFTESMSNDSDDHFAWGGILVATTRQHFKETYQFTALEDNETVMDLVYPGSDLSFDGDGPGYSGQIKVPDLQAKFKVAFQTRTGGQIWRVVSRNYAQIDERGDAKKGEEDLQSRQLTVAIYPDDDGVLFDTFKGDRDDSGSSGS
jgi:hypothetical protein